MSLPPDFVASLPEADQEYMHVFGQGDAAALAALYTENAQFLAPNSDFVTGRKALQQMFEAFMGMGIKSIELESTEAEQYGETATSMGRYKLAGEDGQILDQGKFIVIWKFSDGKWRLHRDMINSSLPAA